MSIELLTLLMFGFFILLLLMGVPLAFALGGLAVVFGFILKGDAVFAWMTWRTWAQMSKFGFVAIPLFIFMANMLRYSGIVEDLFNTIYQWMGPLRGGLALATIAVAVVVAAMVGTAGGDVIIMGLTALPAMLRRKYDKSLALGSVLAGGSLGVLVPPSILFVIYGLFAGQSVGKLFMGGLFPGLLLASLYASYILLRSWLQPAIAPALTKEEGMIPLRHRIALAKSLVLPILLIAAIMGSIFFGLATPTEAAGIGAAGAILCAAIRRQLNWQNLKGAIYATIRTVNMVFWVTFGAYAFVGVYIVAGGGEFISNILLGLPVGPWTLFLLVQVLLILMGMVINWVGILVLVVPIVLPVLTELGFDPLWFGVVFAVNMQIGYLSPPFGLSLFYLKGVTPPEISMTDIYRSTVIFIVLQIIGLGILIGFPQIALWLPNQMFGK